MSGTEPEKPVTIAPTAKPEATAEAHPADTAEVEMPAVTTKEKSDSASAPTSASESPASADKKQTDGNPVILMGSDVVPKSAFKKRIEAMSKRTKIIILSVIGLLILSLILYLVVPHKPKDLGRDTAKKITAAAVSGSVMEPNYETAEVELKTQLTETRDKSKLVDIYTGLVAISVAQKKHQDVITYQKKIHDLDPSRKDVSANTLAQAYEGLGNKTEALSYYQQALGYYKSRPDTYSGKTYFVSQTEAKIAELKQ